MNRIALSAFTSRSPKVLVIAACVCLALFGAGIAWAQSGGSYTINWFSIDGGAGNLAGGTYTLRGTIGQPEGNLLTGGTYSLQGGITKLPSAGIVIPPSTPALAPTRNFYTSNVNIPLSWSTVTWAVGYEAQIATNSIFTTGFITSGVLPPTQLTWSPTVPGNGTYYFRVRALKATPPHGGWSLPQTFRVILPS